MVQASVATINIIIPRHRKVALIFSRTAVIYSGAHPNVRGQPETFDQYRHPYVAIAPLRRRR